MASRPLPLHDLAQRINQHEAELETLRREYQVQLQKLTLRKEELQNQLQQIEVEIRGIDQKVLPQASKSHNAKPAPKPAAKPAPKSTAPKPATKAAGGLSLSQLLIQLVKKAGRPMTTKELTAELIRRKYQTTSNNLAGMVEKRITELVKKGVFRRPKDQPGVLPAMPPTPAAAKPPTGGLAPGSKPAPKTPSAAGSDVPLTTIVTQILSKSSNPMTARELADKVLATGYQTKSQNFTNVIWAGMGKMDNVENVPGKGYRLKRGKTAPESKGAPSR